MKKTLVMILAMMLCIGLLPATLAGEQPYKYSMVMYNFGPLDEEPAMEKIWEEKYGVNFDLIYVENSSLQEQVNLMIASNEIPDVMQHIDSASYFDQGILGGWTEEFFREHAPRLSAYIDEIEPAAWAYAKFDGELMYSIPGFRLYNTVASPYIWRTDWLKKVGIEEIPEKLEDVEAAFYKFVNEDPDGNGIKDTFAMSSTTLNPIYGAFGTFRGKWLEDGNGGVIYGDVKPEAKEALELLNKWYKDGIIDPEFITGENQGGYWALSHAFMNGRIGVSGIGQFYHWVDATEFEGGTMVGRVAAALKEAGTGIEYAPGHPPVGPNGHSGTDLPHVTSLRTFFSASLVADTARFGRLLEIIDDMMMDPETCISVSRGIEGETYEIVDWNGVKTIKMLVANNTDAINGIGAAAWFYVLADFDTK